MRRSSPSPSSHKRRLTRDLSAEEEKKPFIEAVLALPYSGSDLDEVTTQQLRGVFLACDEDADGRLSASELQYALAMVGIVANPSYIQRRLSASLEQQQELQQQQQQQLTQDGEQPPDQLQQSPPPQQHLLPLNGKYEFEHFASLVATEIGKPGRMISIQNLRELMQVFDEERTGLISGEDFRHLMMRTSSARCLNEKEMRELEKLIIPAHLMAEDPEPRRQDDRDTLGLGYGGIRKITEQYAKSRSRTDEGQQGLAGQTVDYESLLQAMMPQFRRSQKAIHSTSRT